MAIYLIVHKGVKLRNNGTFIKFRLDLYRATARERVRTSTPFGNMALNHARLPIPPPGRMSLGQPSLIKP